MYIHIYVQISRQNPATCKYGPSDFRLHSDDRRPTTTDRPLVNFVFLWREKTMTDDEAEVHGIFVAGRDDDRR